MKNIPNKIYLQTPCMGELDEFPEMETTWCSDKINEDDIGPYVRSESPMRELICWQSTETLPIVDGVHILAIETGGTVVELYRDNSYSGVKWRYVSGDGVPDDEIKYWAETPTGPIE